MPGPTAAIQLIVFGQRNRDDIAGVLKDVAEAGYPAIEGGNMFASYGEAQIRRMLEQNGLAVCGAHFGYGDYADAAKLDANIAYCRAMGIKNMMCSGVADAKSAEGYRASCRTFNEVGRKLADAGIAFNYHNHNWEFADMGGVNGMQIIAAETDPALVKFNIDVFWVTIGGSDPVEFIRQHADRAGYYHFKDGRKGPGGDVEFLELGRGDVDLKGSIAAAKALGASWIVYEQDRTELPHREAIGISRRYMRGELGV